MFVNRETVIKVSLVVCLNCRCFVTEPGPPAPGFPGSAGSTLPATGSHPAGALPASQAQQLLTPQPVSQFQHGKTDAAEPHVSSDEYS